MSNLLIKLIIISLLLTTSCALKTYKVKLQYNSPCHVLKQQLQERIVFTPGEKEDLILHMSLVDECGIAYRQYIMPKVINTNMHCYRRSKRHVSDKLVELGLTLTNFVVSKLTSRTQGDGRKQLASTTENLMQNTTLLLLDREKEMQILSNAPQRSLDYQAFLDKVRSRILWRGVRTILEIINGSNNIKALLNGCAGAFPLRALADLTDKAELLALDASRLKLIHALDARHEESLDIEFDEVDETRPKPLATTIIFNTTHYLMFLIVITIAATYIYVALIKRRNLKREEEYKECEASKMVKDLVE